MIFLCCPSEIMCRLYICIIKLVTAKKKGVYEVKRGIYLVEGVQKSFIVEGICNNCFRLGPELLVVRGILPDDNPNLLASCEQLVDQSSANLAGSAGYKNFAHSRYRSCRKVCTEQIFPCRCVYIIHWLIAG
jgi:hypothetical protein